MKHIHICCSQHLYSLIAIKLCLEIFPVLRRRLKRIKKYNVTVVIDLSTGFRHVSMKI